MNFNEILEGLKKEIHNTVRGAFDQGGTKEDIEEMIHNLIEEDFEKISKKYEE